MVMAVQPRLVGVENVVEAALAVYQARHERVIQVALMEMVDCEVSIDVGRLPVVAAVDSRVAEIVVDETVICDQLAAAVWSLADQGWRVTVLVATHRTGEGHFGLRGTPCRLQTWWETDAGIDFGSYETP